MVAINQENTYDIFIDKFILNSSCVFASLTAIALSFTKIGRKRIIFFSYFIVEICFLGSLITKYSNKQPEYSAHIVLTFLYHVSCFSAKLGLIFVMLATAELFPTSLRCTGMGLCFSMKIIGSLISSTDMLGYNSEMHRLGYCLLTLFFGSMALFLPETRSFPLPRSILQIEAMPTTIGKILRSKKVKLAYENRQDEYEGKAKGSEYSNIRFSI